MNFTCRVLFGIIVISAASCSDDRSSPAKPPAEGVDTVDREEPAQVAPAAEARPEHDGASAAPLPLGACGGPPGRSLRTLVVGNSQIYFWDLPKLLSVISQSGPPACPRIAAEGFTRGGQNLRRLWEGGDSLGRDLPATIAEGRYDVVVIAESIDLVELLPLHASFVKHATKIIEAVRAAGAVPILYATPYADQEDHWGFREMAAPQIALGAELSVTVAAGGLAWLRVWSELPELDLHHPDNAHPGYKGSYISALVLYAAITRATPVGLTTAPPFECNREPCPKLVPITAEETDVFQRAAWEEAQATAFN